MAEQENAVAGLCVVESLDKIFLIIWQHEIAIGKNTLLKIREIKLFNWLRSRIFYNMPP